MGFKKREVMRSKERLKLRTLDRYKRLAKINNLLADVRFDRTSSGL
jgi:hypothetical protein